MHELDALAARRDELDDAELANLEEQSQVVDDLAAAHRAEVDLAATAERSTAELAAAEAAIDDEIAALTVQRSEAVDPTRPRDAVGLRAAPSALRWCGRRPSGRPAVRRLPPRPVDGRARAVKATPAGEYTDCPQCGRMLIP